MPVTNKTQETVKAGDMKDLILDATLQVVSRNTISETRMQLIADEAGIPKSNLHYYFKTKHNLLLALHERAIDRLISRRKCIRRESIQTLREQLRIFFDEKLHTILEESEFDLIEIDFWVQSNIDPEYKKNLVDSFRLWREEIVEVLQSYRPDLPERKVKMIPCLMISLMEGATLQYHLDSAHFDLEGYMDYCVEYICAQVGEE